MHAHTSPTTLESSSTAWPGGGAPGGDGGGLGGVGGRGGTKYGARCTPIGYAPWVSIPHMFLWRTTRAYPSSPHLLPQLFLSFQ